MFDNVYIECFSEIPDKRYKNKRHLFLDVIAICICGILAGMNDFDEIHCFAQLQKQWFKQYLALPHGIPSSDTLERIIASINPKQFSKSFLLWVNKLKQLFPETIIPIDGKTLRGSHQRGKGLKPLHIVNAFSYANGLTLGQVAVDSKSNEITAIPELLETIMIKGAIITIDAMGTQKEIAKQIIDQEADYLLAVKGNQKELQQSIIDVFALANNANFSDKLKPIIYNQAINADHGRIESRIIKVLPASTISHIIKQGVWANLTSIVQVNKIDHVNETIDTRYFISSLSINEVERIATAVRAHWSIENNLHWVLDVTFKEDDSRVRSQLAAENLSWIRKMAIHLLKYDERKLSKKNKMIYNCIDPTYISKLFKES